MRPRALRPQLKRDPLGGIRTTLKVPSWILPVCVIAACAAPHPTTQPPAPSASIFRYIDIAPYGRIELGAPFGADSLVTQISDSVVELPRQTFGGTDRITIHLTPDRKVYAMSFLYPQGTSYDAMVESYTEDLGPPTRMNHGVYWDDRRTRFMIIVHRVEAAEVVASRMIDLVLAHP